MFFYKISNESLRYVGCMNLVEVLVYVLKVYYLLFFGYCLFDLWLHMIDSVLINFGNNRHKKKGRNY